MSSPAGARCVDLVAKGYEPFLVGDWPGIITGGDLITQSAEAVFTCCAP
jgi:hypothetical protein